MHSSASFDHILANLREYTLEFPYEVCGTIEIGKYEYVAYIHDLTPPLKNGIRPHCIFEHTEDPIIWHNHPDTSKFYPSMEDIVKGLKPKNKHIIHSFIFCVYGIWHIKYNNHDGVTEEEKEQVTNALHSLYFTSGRGRVYNLQTNWNVDRVINTINHLFSSRLTIEFLGTPY
jgi:hypothetical protein